MPFVSGSIIVPIRTMIFVSMCVEMSNNITISLYGSTISVIATENDNIILLSL